MKILLIAYAIEPGKGSEEGIGYGFAKEIAAAFPDVTLITRPNNIPALTVDPAFQNVKLIGVDVPKSIGFFKKKQRGIHLYYYLWQRMVGRFVRQMDGKFDIIHQITFAAAWAPHFLGKNDARIVWGPLLNHAPIPRTFTFYKPTLSHLKDNLKQALKFYFFKVSPAMQRAVANTNTVFYGSPGLSENYKNAVPLTAAGSNFKIIEKKERHRNFDVLFVGRFVDLKGCVPALAAFKVFYDRVPVNERPKIAMRFIGGGPLESLLKAMAWKEGIPVSFTPWQQQKDLEQSYDRATVFLFPSFEGQGLVVVEAMARGCPVVCLDGTGPSMLAGNTACAVKLDHYEATVNALADQLFALYQEYRDRPDKFASRIQNVLKRAREFTWENKMTAVKEAYHA